MILHPLDSFAAASGTSPTVSLQRLGGKDECTVQVSISASAAVSVQGRLSAEAPWYELIAITSNSIQPIAALPYLQFVVTGNSGTVDVWVRQ